MQMRGKEIGINEARVDVNSNEFSRVDLAKIRSQQ
jgi:hypothetical protein